MKTPLAGDDLREEVRPHYHALLSRIAASTPQNQKLAVFSPLVGAHYDLSESRLLVYGRSVDGWRHSFYSHNDINVTMDALFNIPDADKAALCEMNWLVRNRKAWLKNREGNYNYKTSSFWSAVRDVVKDIEEKSILTGDIWQSRLAWSNVYKVSPCEGGNPTEELRTTQIKHCIDILQTEIRVLKPKHILFVTGGWGKKILESIEVYGDYTTNKTIQFAGKVNDANVVVTKRPERHKRRQWVKEVVSAFRSVV